MKISVAYVASPQISCTTRKGEAWVYSLKIFQEAVSGMTAPTGFKAK
jgi:hypothetical protein